MLGFTKDKKTFYIIMEGIAGTVILNLLSNYIMMFAKRMGAHNIQIALLSSLPPLVAIFVLIPCGILVEKMSNKKAVACVLIGINGLFYLLIAAVPFIPLQIRLTTYVIIIGVMNWPGSLYTTVWQSFFSDNFYGDEANRVYSLRSMFCTLVGLITLLIAGYVLSALPGSDSERIMIYQLFFLICFILSLSQIFFLSRVKNNDCNLEVVGKKKTDFKISEVRGILKNKSFMLFCACSFVFHFAWQACWPIIFIYHVNYIKVNEFQLAIISVASGLASFLSYWGWNKLAGRKGNSLIIIFGSLGLSLNPFLYMKIWSFHSIVIINAFIGVAASAFTLTLFCSLLELLPEEQKTVYISFFNTLVSITGFTAPLLSVWIMNNIGITWTFLIFGTLRLTGTALYTVRWLLIKKRTKIPLTSSNLGM